MQFQYSINSINTPPSRHRCWGSQSRCSQPGTGCGPPVAPPQPPLQEAQEQLPPLLLVQALAQLLPLPAPVATAGQ